jgi:hypothetical protein
MQATKIQVSKDSAFRKRVAECIVFQAHPGYSYNFQGSYYADPVEGEVWHCQSNAPWNPWPDSTFVVDVDDLVIQEGNDFSDVVDWKLVESELPYRDMVAAYLNNEGEEFEANGDIPEWVDINEVVEFARKNGWQEQIEEQEAIASTEAVNFALSEFLDEIEVSDEERGYEY